jgi:transcriptional regulator with GAF, ATPase, and Fis domain
MAAQAADRLDEAAQAYAAARDHAREAADVHGAAIYSANLATVLREQGEYARALGPTEEAVRRFTRLGKQAERAIALFNHGNLALSLGDPAQAAAAARQALAAAPAPRERGYGLLLQGDAARAEDHAAEAEAADRSAAAAFAESPREAVLALRALAELAAAAGDEAAARDHLARAEAVAGAAHEGLLALTRLRLCLDAGGIPDAEARRAVASRAAELAAAGRRPEAFRAALLAARAATAAGDAAAARAALARARTLWEEIMDRTPELSREAAARDPDARKLRALVEAAGGEPAPRAAPPRRDPWRRLALINKRLNSELRLDPLLELILDTVIDLTSAERGFVLLADSDGALRVKSARNMDQRSIAEDQTGRLAFSRSIAERAARDAEPIVTLDASGDERFEAARSVSHLRLRSVLAVPLMVKGRVVGCVYADHRLRAGAFDEEAVELVCDLADQAAIAVENARLLAENQRKEREVAALNRELERTVAEQAAELGALNREVRKARAEMAVRYDYGNLVGQTPRMLELFRLLDRVTDTDLPVVIYGESGTGKELVARAIHFNGPRRARPFVSESCAAIPEPLLEAALFGHVRGAFTGADAERRGLFEVAHQGTLFLDEVGEMPPAMQVKLLRVLTTGELRRLGGEKMLKVDVRVVCASNRDLGRLVEEGRFREDLYYRLNVVKVALPPLRERKDDIPLLVEHFLAKLAGEGMPRRRISRGALARLAAWSWPGNVRELENEVRRAAALGGEVIAVDDLSPRVAAGDAEADVDSPDDLGLKRRVERLERTLLREALGRTGGNQTQAARLLGLSRFGLQKKLRRYRLAP